MDIIVPIFEKLFNNILNSGIYPSMWCEAILCPIYKQGNISVEKKLPWNFAVVELYE